MALLARLVIGLCLALAWRATAGSLARADDVVYLGAAAEGAARKLTGEVVDYDARQLRLRAAGGRQRTIPADQVERVDTSHCAEQSAGDELFAGGDLRAAQSKYRAALEGDREPRGWVRQEIVADIARCQQASGQWMEAGETFLALVAAVPETRFVACIPLPWTTTEPGAALEQKARSWLREANNPVANLLGAGHLLSTREGPRALDALQRLASDRDIRIAFLAQAQSWRAAAAGAAAGDLEQWSRTIEAGDGSLRAGAYFVLGSALAKQQPEAAALTLLKLPILYPRQPALAATALLAAGDCLDRAGRATQAASLYREVIAGYRQAPEAEEAQRRLASLAARGR